MAGHGAFFMGDMVGKTLYLPENTIRSTIRQFLIVTSQLLHNLLYTNDTDTEPGDGGGNNSIHLGGCLIDGAVNGGV